MQAALLSSKDMGWQTPESYLERVRRIGPILFDPCSVSSNPTKAKWFVAHDHGQDSLHLPWCQMAPNVGAGGGLTFVNPPYGRELPVWVDKVLLEAREGLEVVLLVPSRTDTRWYNRALHAATCTLSHAGRIKFVDAATGKAGQSAAFPSVTFYFGPRERLFREAFHDLGTFVRVDD